MILYRNPRLELYAHKANRRRPNGAYGIAAKIRTAHGWRHLGLFMRPWPSTPKPNGRGVVTVEAQTWLTEPDKRTRRSIKAFVRLKVGLGGPNEGSE